MKRFLQFVHALEGAAKKFVKRFKLADDKGSGFAQILFRRHRL